MALSVRSSTRAGNPLGGGEDWGDSPYGSLITLGPKTFKKKPVLVLAAEELAEAHLAMAMGGAEIMDMMPDPASAPRPRQPSVMLGLVPMGATEPDEDRAAYVVPADDLAEDWVPLPDYDEPEEPEAEIQTWIPEDEPDEWEDATFDPVGEPGDADAGDAADAPGLGRLLSAAAPDDAVQQAAPEPQVPSIEEQLERMRERLARRAAATGAAPAATVAEPSAPAEDQRLPTIERLEIDDWSGSASLKGFIPPQESDLAPAPPAPVAAPEAEPKPEPAPPLVFIAPEPVAEGPAPVDPAPAFIAQNIVADEPYEPELAAALAEDEVAEDDLAALDAWAEHVAPVAPPPQRYGGIRARLSDTADWQAHDDQPAPGLLARLWAWLRNLA